MFLRTICMHLFFSFFERRGPLNRLTALSSFAAIFIWSSRADGPASAFRPRKCMWNVKSIWKTIVWFSNWFRCCLPCRTKPKMLVSEGWRCVLWESTSLPAKRNAKSNKRLCLECLEVRTLSILFSCRSVQIPQQPGQHSLMLMSPLKLWRFEQLGCRRSQSIGMSLTPLIQFFGDVFVLDCHSHTHTHTSNPFIEETNSLANNLLYRFPSCTICSFPLLRFVFICLTKKSYDLKPFWRSLCLY